MDDSHEEWQQLEPHAKAIDKALKSNTRNLFVIGEHLSQAQQELANRGNGSWGRWCEVRLDMTRPSANAKARVYDRFKDCKKFLQTCRDTVLYEMSKKAVPEAAVQEFLDTVKAGTKVTRKMADEIIERHREGRGKPSTVDETHDRLAEIFLKIEEPDPQADWEDWLEQLDRTQAKAKEIIDEEPERPYTVWLDSGSFSHQKEAEQFAKETGRNPLSYYQSDQYVQYMEDYAAFVSRWRKGIDRYASLDVIGNSQLSLRGITWLEERGLKPFPVVHYPSRYEWLARLVMQENEDGTEKYDVIGLGNLVRNINKQDCQEWIQGCFDVMSRDDGRMYAKLHGFGVGSHEQMLKFPWYSVDASTWLVLGNMREIIVPKKKDGQFDFSSNPQHIAVSQRKKIAASDRDLAEEWLEYIGIRWQGRYGNVSKDYKPCRAANLLYYEELREAKPDKCPVIFFSGSGTEPEDVLGHTAHIMPSFAELRKEPKPLVKRFQSILDHRETPIAGCSLNKPVCQNYVCLVPCGKRKQDKRCKACEMYTGPHSKGCIQWAANNFPNRWRILSAKYGLLDPDKIIKPYEDTLADMLKPDKDAWAAKVRCQLEKEFGKGQKYLSLAGKAYSLPDDMDVTRVFRTTSGQQALRMGEQTGWLKEHPVLDRSVARMIEAGVASERSS